MALVSYSSSSSSTSSTDDDEKLAKTSSKSKCKRIKLETTPTHSKNLLPGAIKQLGVQKKTQTVDGGDEYDDPAKHDGRIRSFKHERGNWATYIYIPVPTSILEDVREICQKLFDGVVPLKEQSDPHISLSRTVVLQYHLIDSFVKSLEDEFQTALRFCACLHKLKIYTNEEKTRTFIAFQIAELYVEKFKKLLEKVNGVMSSYKLPKFYEEPSFHVSVLWCLGDQVKVLSTQIQQLQNIIANDTYTLDINKVYCKSGNKEFQFKLK